MRHLLPLLVCLLLCLIATEARPSITIDSVAVTPSTCVNNGVAVVYATGAGGLLYAIAAGPVLSPIQNSNTFSSLYPGNYTVRVYDVNFDSLDYQFQITGTYQLPDFSLDGIDPTCPGGSDGSITVLADSSVGLTPFTYEVIAPIAIPSQSSPVFANLSANTYFVRLTDDCGNYQTRTIILSNSGTGLITNSFMVPAVEKIGCDTIRMTNYLYLYKDKWTMPISVTYNTSVGVITRPANLQVLDTVNSNPGLFQIVDTIVGLTYGDFLGATYTDVCGVSVSTSITTISPFDFEVLFSATTVNCVATFSGSIRLKQYHMYPYTFTYPMNPHSFVLTDINTGAIVDSGSCNTPFCTLQLLPQSPGSSFNLTVTDGCGEVWQQTIIWPVSGTATVNVFNGLGCMDSTATLIFECLGFRSAPKVTILSGPSNASSTKPFYAYTDTIIYPQSYFGGTSPMYIYLKDFPQGLYTYQVEDSCGNIITGSFLVEPWMLSNPDFLWYVKPSCLNNNTFFYDFSLGTGGVYVFTLTDSATNQVVFQKFSLAGLDSVTTLSIGTYYLNAYYSNFFGGGQYFDGGLFAGTSCWVLQDTIRITPYLNNSFLSNSTVYCNGDYYVSLTVDSSRGVPPYRYAIISGPQLFPLQDSSFFLINAFGNYVISMEDACGNNYTQQISVTSDSISPVTKRGFFCEGSTGSLSMVSSPYFTHTWQYPDGTMVTGDSIVFQPFMSSDTGQYVITSVISINGCTDSVLSIFYLSGKDSVSQSFQICQGDTVFVAGNAYVLPGIYRDTLTTLSGCDSVIITNIQLQQLQTDSVSFTLCPGDTVLYDSLLYTMPGLFTDTVLIAGSCKKVVVATIISGAFTDSAKVSICAGDSIQFGSQFVSLPGVYTDTLSGNGSCDTLLVLELQLIPLLTDTLVTSICSGDSLQVGSEFYVLPGVYTDTLPVPGSCRKVQVTYLSVLQWRDSVAVSICQGDTVMVGNSVYTNAGVYTDTLASASGCDSIVVTNISIVPFLVDTVTAEICAGDVYQVGANVYTQSGVYTDTIQVSSGCNRIQISQLTFVIIRDTVNAVLCVGDTFFVASVPYVASGVYVDTLQAVSGCDSIQVSDITFISGGISLISDTLCQGDSIWFNGSFLTQQGLYSDTLSAGNCDSIIQLQLTVFPGPSLNLTASAQQTSPAVPITLSAPQVSGWQYAWSGNAVFQQPSSFSTGALLSASAWMYLTIVNENNCVGMDSIFISVIPDAATDTCKEALVFMPNAFTPNNDGLNDRYYIKTRYINILNYKIYNRWGELLFSSAGKADEWDGSFRGVKCPAGVYVCTVEYENCYDLKPVTERGFITLLE